MMKHFNFFIGFFAAMSFVFALFNLNLAALIWSFVSFWLAVMLAKENKKRVNATNLLLDKLREAKKEFSDVRHNAVEYRDRWQAALQERDAIALRYDLLLEARHLVQKRNEEKNKKHLARKSRVAPKIHKRSVR